MRRRFGGVIERAEQRSAGGFDGGFGSGKMRSRAIEAMAVRLILFMLFIVGAGALVAVLLAWLAERRLDQTAEAWSFGDVTKVPAADVALVLGTSPIGPEGGPNVYFVRRLDAAAALWKAGKVKYLVVSGSGDEPPAMRAGLIDRGVAAAAIYRDPAGYRTWDSVLGMRDVYGQKRIVVVSQRFHLSRALFLARQSGMEAWGFEARDVEQPYSIFTELRRYPSALRAYLDVWTDTPSRMGQPPVRVGVDPPS